MALARHSLMESYSTGRLESRLATMVTAAEYYKKAAKAEFSLSCVEESARLLKYQASLEEKRGKVTDYSYLSVDYIATRRLLFDLIN